MAQRNRLRRYLGAALMALLLLPGLGSGVVSADSLSKRTDMDTATDTATANNPVKLVCGPLPFVTDGERCERGIGAELARAACVRAHLTCQFQQYPWPRAQKEVEMQQADILIGPFYSAEREAWLVFSREHFYVDQMWLFRAVPAEGAIPEANGVVHVGVPLGWAIGGDLDRRPGLIIESVRTVDIGLTLVATGRLDAVAAHARAVARYQAEQPGSHFLPAGPALSVQRSYMGFSTSFAGSVERRLFETAYDALLSDPFYEVVLTRNKPFPEMRTEIAGRGHLFLPGP